MTPDLFRAGGRPAACLRVALAAGLSFALLFFAVTRGWLAGPDHALLTAFAALRGPLTDGFFLAVSWLGSGYVLAPAALLIAAALVARREGRAAALLALTYFGASLTTWLLKFGIGRERPALHMPLVEIAAWDLSFPSSHATQSAAFALGLWLLAARWRPRWRRPVGLALVAVVLLVAASRLHLQVHWPSDLLGGLLVAAGWAGLATALLVSHGEKRT